MAMEAAGLSNVNTVRGTMTGTRAIVIDGETGVTIGEIVGRGPGPREGGHDPGIGTTGDGNGLGKEWGMIVTLTSEDGQITEQKVHDRHILYFVTFEYPTIRTPRHSHKQLRQSGR
jgi:hypothetical protein